VRHLTLDELNKKIKKEEKSVRVLERLYFIKYIYKGHSIKEACENVDISEPTGYNWLDLWNKRDMADWRQIFQVVQSQNWVNLTAKN